MYAEKRLAADSQPDRFFGIWEKLGTALFIDFLLLTIDYC